MRAGRRADADGLRLRGSRECGERQEGGEAEFLERHLVTFLV